MAIKLVIFDMDGVIFDSEPMHELAEYDVLRAYGVNVKDGDPLPCGVGLSSDETYELMMDHFHFEADVKELSVKHFEYALERTRNAGIPLSGGLAEFVDLLDAKGIPYRVASSSLHFFVEGALAHYGLLPRIKGLLGGDDVIDRKPAPDLYLKTLELAGVSAEEAIAIEDSKTGMAAAVAAGIRCIGYRNPTSGDQDLSAGWKTVNSFREIPELLF